MIDSKLQEQLRARFNPDNSLLRQIQLRQLEILKYVDDVCKKNDIPYWLSSGTLIGAVRHAGFIPWDDDLDIEMLKPDFDKLCGILKAEPMAKFVLQTHDTDPEYVASFAKVRDVNSELFEDCGADRWYTYRGVYIDIFALVPSNSAFITRITGSLQWRFLHSLAKLNNSRIRKIMTTIMYTLLHRLLFPILTFLTSIGVNGRLRQLHGSTFIKPRFYKDIFPLKLGVFEGLSFPIPNAADQYLRRIYGDYTQLPDMEHLHVHASRVRLFDD